MSHWHSENGLTGLLLGAADEQAPQTALLHGFTGAADDWTPCLPASTPALALNLPGHGASADPRGGWEQAIGDILDALPPRVDRLVGYSLGGRIALGLLRAAPSRFRSLTLISAHPGVAHPAERAVRRATDRCWIELIRRDGVEGFVRIWEGLPLFEHQTRLPRDRLERQRARRLSHRAEGLMASLEVLGLAEMPDTRADLRRFDGEVRWIVGAKDRKFLRIAREIEEMRPETEVLVLPEVGHNALLEAPATLSTLLLASSRPCAAVRLAADSPARDGTHRPSPGTGSTSWM